jgi:3-oxoacyl-[acyl-carrier protein] reductase
MRLKDKVCVVTGAAQGIGLATAERLARDGFEVVAMDRQAERLEPAVAALCAQGLPVLAAVCDVCDRAALAAVLDSRPRVDVMVCAAGIYNDAAFLDLDEGRFRQMLEVNVVGTFIPAQEAARRAGLPNPGRSPTSSCSCARRACLPA